MAKRRGRPPGSGRATQAAESIGTALGGVMARVDAWMSQREQIAQELRRVADMMMKGGGTRFSGRAGAAASAQAAAPAAATAASGGAAAGRTRKRRTMSAEARAKIAAAQKARWARQKGQAAAASPKGGKKAK